MGAVVGIIHATGAFFVGPTRNTQRIPIDQWGGGGGLWYCVNVLVPRGTSGGPRGAGFGAEAEGARGRPKGQHRRILVGGQPVNLGYLSGGGGE